MTPRRRTRKPETLESRLSRRERQTMDVLFRRGEATVAEVLGDLPDPPTYSAVRAMMRTLEEKGHVAHRQDGPRYVYQPTVPADEARDSALRRVLRTFFDGSATRAVAALIDLDGDEMTDEELARLTELVERAKRREDAP